ncbi:heterokaryon incompatibility protein-domain-containing protein [Stachybotrys elegans]|uniref:Heterokaryon incompatibility protein-domain-containing protein n=1 Tax=Stachybotrys elegans TaxID=80388 RepID=A0A8K0T1Q0_9HYPO|nr:heterokaryon incompatibility protein-domain-containing protein [Stachybotrys elegans]
MGTMPLCSTCLDIPFSSLPKPPETDTATRVVDNDELRCLWPDPSPFGDAPGHPWHESLEVLAASAQAGCPLCHLVQGAVRKWIGAVEAAPRKSRYWKEFIDDYVTMPYGRRLWLTQRYGGAPGLVVFVLALPPNLGKRGPDNLYLLGSVAFHAKAGSPLAGGILPRPLHPDSGSAEGLEAAAAWVRECASKHEKCSDEASPLPTRILDVGGCSDVAKLIEPAPGSIDKYAALSYCWGQSLPFKTTRDSYQARKKGINIPRLPQTFQDAVKITRHLGLQYLWIDSICILQDDSADWARESARMTNVYSGAYIVISANRSKASNGGCFHVREPRLKSTMHIPELGNVEAVLLFNDDCFYLASMDFCPEPLSARAWALQESALARRSLRYNTRQMYFGCRQGIVSEDGCIRKSPRWPLDPLFAPGVSRQNAIDIWSFLLREYTERNLTKATDKLPAISGIASLVGERLGCQYVAGLWSDALVYGLAWKNSELWEVGSTAEYTGPSWSWASYAGIVRADTFRCWRDAARIEAWDVELKNQDNPYGEVKSATIKVHGPMSRLRHREQEKATNAEARMIRAGRNLLPRVYTDHHPLDIDEGEYVLLDYRKADDSVEWPKWDLQIMVLGGRLTENDSLLKRHDEEKPDNKGDEIETYHCLVLKPVQGGALHFKRVGRFTIGHEVGSRIVADEKAWRTVTLV